MRRLCIEAGCPNPPTARGRCDEHRKELERERSRRRRADPDRGQRVALYHKKRWLTTRSKVLARDPICKVCNQRLATEVDHIVPLSQGGDPWDLGGLQGICGPCHRVKSGREARGAC
jgi:5-methylcytosine-specific restriction protein A